MYRRVEVVQLIDHRLCDDRRMSHSHRRLLVIVLFTLTAAATAHGAEPAGNKMDQRVAKLRKSPPELYAFLYRMPKGADLHNHVAGAVYAENFLEAAIEQQLCLDKAALAIVRCTPGGVNASAIRTDNALRNALIDSFSMRNFVPGRQSAEDHFFDAFDKFLAVSTADLVAEIAQRAADQNESYVELMGLDGGGPIAALGKRVGLTDDFDGTRKKLEGAGLPQLVALKRALLD